jgi:L-amino acid N-acyltransferase YncA
MIALGFSKVGHFHEVGFKFGRWLDLVFLQCIIPATAASAAAPAAPKVAPNP